MRTAAAAALTAAALLLAGCGGGDTSSAPVATQTVEMAKSYRFSPESIRVAAGSTVTWRNDDNFTHTVKVGDGDARKVAPGDSVAERFPKAGTFAFVCTLHPGMRGTVVVR